MKNLNKFKGFTLVEVLIVIIIVGILIAALLPRLQGSQARARDVARQWHINQIAQAVALYSADNNGELATGCADSSWVASGFLSSVPTDPQWSNGKQKCSNGEYGVYTDGTTAVAVAFLEGENGNCTPTSTADPDSAGNITLPTITPGSGTGYCVIVQ